MPDIWLPFPRRELIAMRRCGDCGCHPPTQGHKAECPTRKAEEPDAALQG